MKYTFNEVLREQKMRYPRMEPQDYGKLIYQSEFGPRHLVEDTQIILSEINRERAEVSQDSYPQMPELIGNGLCRFPLSMCKSDRDGNLLAELFALTARKHYGSKSGMLEKLRLLQEFSIPGMDAWAEKWREEGYPAVRHSRAYREAYQPHYRLLRRDYAGYFPVLSEIYKMMERKKSIIIGIDGRCGSGKTMLAEWIQTILPCNRIHMDDFYLPQSKRQEGWTEIPGGNIDFSRLISEVLRPIHAGEAVCYRRYCCSKDKMEEEMYMPFRNLTIVEGSYSHHPSLPPYDLKIFITCSLQERKRRLMEREGSYFTMFLDRWMPMEEHYFRSFAIEENSDLQIDTSELFL